MNRANAIFERHIQPEPMSGCWLWSGAWEKDGYGWVADGNGSATQAHRKAWALYVGPVPNGMHVLHRCDTRCCVNPAHLFLGAHADNMRDMASKGRAARRRGQAVPSAKLTEAQAREILGSSERPGAVAARFGVSPALVYAIRKRVIWRHL